MTEQQIFEKLQKIISTVLGKKPESIKKDSDLVGEFDADSLDALDILSRTEREFGLSLRQKADVLSDSFFQKPTVRAIVDIISAELAKSGNTITKQMPKATNEINPEKNTHIPNTEYITVTKDGISPDVLYPYKPQEPAVQQEQPETSKALGIFGRVRRLLKIQNGAEKGMRK